MSGLVLVGRVLFAALFLSSAVGHLTRITMMAGYAKSKGVPAAWPATFVGGILLAAGGISVLLGIWADLGALLLAVFMLPTAVLMHAIRRRAYALVGTAVLAALVAGVLYLLGDSRRDTVVAVGGFVLASLVWLPLTRRWNARAHLCWVSSVFLFVVYLVFILNWTFAS